MLMSLCIPTFNRVHCLRQMLPSIIEQCEKVEDVEVLVVDNCSTDTTKEYVSELLSKHSILRYISNKENIGGDRNFLTCIKNARGKYVWLIGDDDFIVSHGVKHIVSVLKKNSGVLLLQCRDGNGRPADYFYNNYREHLIDCWQSNRWYALHQTLITCNVFRKSHFDLEYAQKKLYTNYAHMFGLRGIFSNGGKTGDIYNIIKIRSKRMPFSTPVRYINAKQALYYFFLFDCVHLYRLIPYAIYLLVQKKNFKDLVKQFYWKLRSFWEK